MLSALLNRGAVPDHRHRYGWLDAAHRITPALQRVKATVPDSPVDAAYTFQIIRDWRGDYRWQLLSPTGHVLAVSGVNFQSSDAAKRNVRGMQPELGNATIEEAVR